MIRTPLMIRWPGVTKAGAVDDAHMISTVDLLPTILDMLQIAQPGGFDGQSFAAVLKGESQPERVMIFKEHNENAGGQNSPMRAVQTKEWLYIFSPWSNGTRVMSGATNGTSTARQMRVLAKNNELIAARIDLFDHRVPEEAYEVRYDPDALTNLIAKPENAAQVATLEKAMEDWMVRTNDPLLEVFRKRDDATFREQYMKSLEGKQMSAKDRKAANKALSAGKPADALIALEAPKTIVRGQKAIVKVKHTFPADVGEKPIQVTLKGGGNERIERKEVKASGTGIIEELGAEATRDGKWIAYTSADSVFQIAANIDVIPLDELYRACEIARRLCDPYRVGRVIARPFRGTAGNFHRTEDRRDYAFKPDEPTILERLKSSGVPVYAVGKIEDIFAHRGITQSDHTGNNRASQQTVERFAAEMKRGLLFANFIDFDMLHGHRRDPKGYAECLVQTDGWLAKFIPTLTTSDTLIITADHGNDPTFKGSDHTREVVPLLVYQPGRPGISVGLRDGFYDVAQSIASLFGIDPLPRGVAFL